MVAALLTALLATVALSCVIVAESPTVTLRLLPASTPLEMPLYAFVLVSMLAGGLAVLLLLVTLEIEVDSVYPLYLIAVTIAIMSFAAAHLGEMTYRQAALLILFGTGALSFGRKAALLIERGETIEFNSRWGGLGGGLGGWRVSAPTAMLLFAAIFVLGSVVAIAPPTTPAPATTKESGAKPSQAGSGKASVPQNAVNND
jgi:hypothetical protein